MLARLAVRNLRRNLRRTLAVLLTVATGTGSLFIFHGFNAGQTCSGPVDDRQACTAVFR